MEARQPPGGIAQGADAVWIDVVILPVGLQKADHALDIMNAGRKNGLAHQPIVWADHRAALLCQAHQIPAIDSLLGNLFVLTP